MNVSAARPFKLRRPRRLARVSGVGLVALVIGGTIGLAACASPVTIDNVRENYRRALVDSGETPARATCLTDGFFRHRTNAEVRAFQKRAHLTADETAEFSRLATLCADT